MENIKLYEVNPAYVDYLVPLAPHLFHNKQAGQTNERKYIGIVLKINGFEYFAPLSSFKSKHRKIKESLDLIKVKDYAVINLNTMFPVPKSERTYVNIQAEKNLQYRNLLLAEYRVINSLQQKIRKNAMTLYQIKKRDGDKTALSKRCNDFLRLEKASLSYLGNH
ncbi:MAG: type III toxin-antitoxin system ToxN/AbiQ family toxin [Ruminococcus sp.]|nr:type III toxin-antitoxin system ToxN/AbiQ family toxin [Ruminococcus sp.]